MSEESENRSQDYIEMVGGLSSGAFAEVIATSPRKIRETLFGRMGIKAKKKTVGLRLHGKLTERTEKLHVRLKAASSAPENELCEELLRNWLFTKRPLLKATLDFLEVKNDDGLIEEEPTFFQKLEKEKVEQLVGHLREGGYPDEQIFLYLRFVETPHLGDLRSDR